MTITVRHTDKDYTSDPDHMIISGADEYGALSKDIQRMSAISYYGADPDISITIPTGAASKNAASQRAINELLAHAGIIIEASEFSGSSLKVPNKQPDGTQLGPTVLIRVVSALSQGADLSGGRSFNPVLGRATADAIIAHELQRLKLKASEAELCSVTMSNGDLHATDYKHRNLARPAQWVDATINGQYPVTQLREDGLWVEGFDTHHVHEVVTLIFLRPDLAHRYAGSAHEVLEKAGIRFTVKALPKQGAEPATNYIIAQATADQVALALGMAGVIPRPVADEIAGAALAAHPEQAALNTRLAARHHALRQGGYLNALTMTEQAGGSLAESIKRGTGFAQGV